MSMNLTITAHTEVFDPTAYHIFEAVDFKSFYLLFLNQQAPNPSYLEYLIIKAQKLFLPLIFELNLIIFLQENRL